MARAPSSTAVAEPITNKGLHFMNSAFNDTIANGEKFHLNWDKNLHGVDTNLGVFRLSYLDEGIIAYKLAYDLTGEITTPVLFKWRMLMTWTDIVEDRIARWTPEGLNDTLYVFWLRTVGEQHERWAISDPWVPKDPVSPFTNALGTATVADKT